jgi:hypothetical protein
MQQDRSCLSNNSGANSFLFFSITMLLAFTCRWQVSPDSFGAQGHYTGQPGHKQSPDFLFVECPDLSIYDQAVYLDRLFNSM